MAADDDTDTNDTNDTGSNDAAAGDSRGTPEADRAPDAEPAESREPDMSGEQPDDETSTTESSERTRGPAAAWGATGEEGSEGEWQPGDVRGWRRVILSELNASLVGTLTLHYESRDVRLAVDGDAAMRILKIAEAGDRNGLVDTLDPTTGSATRGWVVLSPEEPMALSWLPYRPKPKDRPVAIDPSPTGW